MIKRSCDTCGVSIDRATEYTYIREIAYGGMRISIKISAEKVTKHPKAKPGPSRTPSFDQIDLCPGCLKNIIDAWVART